MHHFSFHFSGRASKAFSSSNAAGAQWVWCFLYIVIFCCSAYGQDFPYLPTEELISPTEFFPWSAGEGLTERAAPFDPYQVSLPEEEVKANDYPQLYRLTKPYYSSILPPFGMRIPPPAGPLAFRTVTTYQPPLGLNPPKPKDADALSQLTVWGGVANSFDSNVLLTSSDQIADVYTSPRAILDYQLGTSEAAAAEYGSIGYDTIAAIDARYEIWGDLYWTHHRFNALNQIFQANGRFGRSGAIWRPFVFYSDITNTDLLTVERITRARRIRASPGVLSNYQFTPAWGANHVAAFGLFYHTDHQFNNINNFRTNQEVTYRVSDRLKTVLWSEYRYTSPSRGSGGSEGLMGLGWVGNVTPRIYSEMRIGWGSVALSGWEGSNGPGIRGLRFHGYTTFDWTQRVRFVFQYDRDYIFNEIGINDNYVATMLQLKTEMFLGGNWYFTPYCAFVICEFDKRIPTPVTLQVRPEGELAYAIQDYSRVFVKVGYEQDLNQVVGGWQKINAIRCSAGFLWNF